MTFRWRHALLACLPIVFAGCATVNTTTDTTQNDSTESYWSKDFWICSGGGALMGAGAGAIESSAAAGWGALGGALVGAVLCGIIYEPPAAEATVQAEDPITPPAEPVKKIVINDVGGLGFALDSAELQPKTKDVLAEVAPELIKTNSQVMIAGYTDTSGPEQYNQELSLKRAESVKTYLSSLGVPADNMKAIGLGEKNPSASNDTLQGRQQNRRVELTIKTEKLIPVEQSNPTAETPAE